MSAIASALAVLFSAFGLLAIWRTLRHQQEQNRNSIYQMVTSRMSGISQIFLQLPELRPYFYDGRDNADLATTDPTLDARVQSMCEMLFDHAEVVLERPRVMGALGDSYERYFCDLVTRSPAMREYWRERRDWYVPAIQALFDGVLAAAAEPGLVRQAGGA